MKLETCESAPSHWQIRSVEDVSKRITSGGTPSRKRSDFYSDGNGIPWVKTQELRDTVVYDTEEHLTELGLTESSAKLLPKGTLLMAMYAAPTAGRMAILGTEMTCNQASCAIVPDSDLVETRWLFYQFLSNRPQLHRLANGAAQQNLSATLIRSLELPIPPIVEQRAIAGVLGALDDKIESNRRLASTAEELGRMEFESVLRQTDGARWAFAWDEVELGSVLSVIETGSRPRGGVAHYTEGVPSIGAESIVKAGHFDFRRTKYVPRDFFDAMRLGKLESGDVLLYKDGGTPGNFLPHVSMALGGFPFEEAAINEHVYRLRISPPFSQAYLYYWLSSPRMLDEMWLRGTGAAIPGLNSSNVKELPVSVPPIELLESVQPRVDLLMDVVFQRAREARTLELLRDSLLPELLSGRLRVRDAESLLEDEL